MVPFSFAGEDMRMVDGRALFWPREQALLVADLHLEKASFFASHGQMLPPYDSRETLGRIADAVRQTGARRVYALGDNFHDGKGSLRLEPHAAGMLTALTRALDWVWITGNHDAGHDAERTGQIVGGAFVDEVASGGLVLRHKARAGEQRPELSGHFHPRLTRRGDAAGPRDRRTGPGARQIAEVSALARGKLIAGPCGPVDNSHFPCLRESH
jgi:uncharacterized protein